MSTDLSKIEPRGGYQPADPIESSPVFVWPPRPLSFSKWLLGFPGYLWPWNALYAATALVTWIYLTPDLASIKTLSVDWIAPIFARNAVLLVLYVSLWHLRLYVQRSQGTEYKYNRRWLSTDNPQFLFRSQLWDNIFWNVTSAVPIWSLYEVATLWFQSRGWVPTVNWHAHPLYCALLMLVVPALEDVHFYLIHRMIHWRPIYRAVHSLHHKNVNPGPWSGLAMHPVEHALYFSGVILYWLIPAHPLHVLFHLQLTALAPTLSHCGFHTVVVGRKIAIDTDDYAHYLHHKYFEVNYGGQIVPIDRWFSTFHDGSAQAQELMHRRLRSRSRARSK